jgi:hypothetical protein
MFSDNCFENLSYVDLSQSNDFAIGGGAHPVGILNGQSSSQVFQNGSMGSNNGSS